MLLARQLCAVRPDRSNQFCRRDFVADVAMDTGLAVMHIHEHNGFAVVRGLQPDQTYFFSGRLVEFGHQGHIARRAIAAHMPLPVKALSMAGFYGTARPDARRLFELSARICGQAHDPAPCAARLPEPAHDQDCQRPERSEPPRR
ncbi:protein of unknown function [Pararobbsia alpina]